MNKMNFRFHKFRVIWLQIAIEILITKNWLLSEIHTTKLLNVFFLSYIFMLLMILLIFVIKKYMNTSKCF